MIQIIITIYLIILGFGTNFFNTDVKIFWLIIVSFYSIVAFISYLVITFSDDVKFYDVDLLYFEGEEFLLYTVGLPFVIDFWIWHFMKWSFITYKNFIIKRKEIKRFNKKGYLKC